MTQPAAGGIDLSSCDREPIHIPGAIQPHGALLALDVADLRIIHAGGRTADFLGLPPATLPGVAAERVFTTDQLARLRDLLALQPKPTHPVHAFSMTIGPTGSRADVCAHRSGCVVILEFEAQPEQPADEHAPLILTMCRRAQDAATVQGFCEAICREIRGISGFDRVMVYRFLADGSGEVQAEERCPEVDSFLGLRYPASDIPQQARLLYLSNLSRIIPDARYTPAPIIPSTDPATGCPLDLSQSVLRSVSPVHRQYMANMGVVASMSLSLVVRGQLWGLIACHHATPRIVSGRLRQACELFAKLASAQLEVRVAAEGFEARLLAKRIHMDLVVRMSRQSDFFQGLLHSHPNLRDFIPAGGVAVWVDGRFTAHGATPPEAAVEGLVGWLHSVDHEGVFHTDRLPLLYPPARAFADSGSGLLALAVSRTARDYVLWFRPEVVRTVTWGGDPHKAGQAGPAGQVLAPRASFAAWQETVRLHASPWLEAEVEAAHRLRLSLLEVVLERIDQLARERETARLRQDELLAELDRRLVQWEATAHALQQETQRRALAEIELSQVLRRTVEDQEAERLRIARELHDTLGQSLTVLQLGLDDILRDASATPAMQARVARVKALGADIGREVNRLAWEIRPTVIDDLGLQAAIQNLLETWGERAQVRFDLHLMLAERRLPPAVETTYYRVLQEALTNVVRHAGASRVGVVLDVSPPQVSMIIEDNGQGFSIPAEPDGRSPRRLGLLGIRERLALIGGTLEVESVPGKGTTLFVRTPL